MTEVWGRLPFSLTSKLEGSTNQLQSSFLALYPIPHHFPFLEFTSAGPPSTFLDDEDLPFVFGKGRVLLRLFWGGREGSWLIFYSYFP